MAKRRVKHKEPIVGLLNSPYRETGMSGFGHCLWWAFCIICNNKYMNKIKPIIGKLIYASIITILLIFIVTLYFQKMEIRGSLIVCKSLPNIELKNRLNYSNGWFSGYASGFVLLDNEKDRPQDMNQYYIIEALNKKMRSQNNYSPLKKLLLLHMFLRKASEKKN